MHLEPQIFQGDPRGLNKESLIIRTRKETESATANFPKEKSRARDVSTGEFYQTFRSELTPILKLSP